MRNWYLPFVSCLLHSVVFVCSHDNFPWLEQKNGTWAHKMREEKSSEWERRALMKRKTFRDRADSLRTPASSRSFPIKSEKSIKTTPVIPKPLSRNQNQSKRNETENAYRGIKGLEDAYCLCEADQQRWKTQRATRETMREREREDWRRKITWEKRRGFWFFREETGVREKRRGTENWWLSLIREKRV